MPHDPKAVALVLFSGGRDSAARLAWAPDRFAHVETPGFDDGRRHCVELDCRAAFRARLAAAFPGCTARLGRSHTLRLDALAALSDTALTREVEIAMRADGPPNTFLPGRNLIFLASAAALAHRRGLRHTVGGMCETGHSGSPDCRDDATWALAEALGGPPLVEAVAEETHTCYLGGRTRRHPWGRGCGTCPARDLRRRGWEPWRRATR